MGCLKGSPELVGSGLHRMVYRFGDFVVKIEKLRLEAKELHKRAVSVDAYQRQLRGELKFLPKYHGTVITVVKRNGVAAPAIVTFQEYVKPLPLFSLEALTGVFKILGEAYGKGYFPDLKPSNFGRRGREILYLDEYGIGKRPIPPDVLEDLGNFLKTLQRIVKK